MCLNLSIKFFSSVTPNLFIIHVLTWRVYTIMTKHLNTRHTFIITIMTKLYVDSLPLDYSK